MYRTLFVTCGNPAKLESNDYVLRGFQNGLTFTACIISDSLFCWRLYVIWSRNVRIILIPAFLLALNTIGCTLIVVTDFHLAYRPKDKRYGTAYVGLWMAVLGIVIVHTSYITLFIVGRLWSVGSAANRFVSPQEVKKNRYQEAINALIQSGAIYLVAMLLCICALASERVIFIAAVRGVAADANSISSILLFLTHFKNGHNTLTFMNHPSQPAQPSNSRTRRRPRWEKGGGRECQPLGFVEHPCQHISTMTLTKV
ncbi:hypothetical protein FRB94_012979 [Tulasnella sp. JGI-2019a]|nr:hypothetical protein FRB94_012979 [Tulasnella sp. JGI-2019a]